MICSQNFQKVSDVEDHAPDSAAESWREPVDKALRTYCKQHYPHGSISVSILFLLV